MVVLLPWGRGSIQGAHIRYCSATTAPTRAGCQPISRVLCARPFAYLLLSAGRIA
jgi:hypothetical protein